MFGDFAHMKKFILISWVALVIFVSCILWYGWDSGTNHGYWFGYYGEFNRVSNSLASIPGITITQAWANCDVRLRSLVSLLPWVQESRFVLQSASATASAACLAIRWFLPSKWRLRKRPKDEVIARLLPGTESRDCVSVPWQMSEARGR